MEAADGSACVISIRGQRRSPRGLLWAATVLLAFALSAPAGATPAPVVFDFEDGLQGWQASGSATRLNTTLLGGQWAIFGDGSVDGASESVLSMETDLTGIASISIDQLFVDAAPTAAFVFLSLVPSGGGLGFVFEELPPFASPRTRSFDVSALDGVFDVRFTWGPGQAPTTAGFVDNIAFHPVPEPSSLVLALLGVGLLSSGARRAG